MVGIVVLWWVPGVGTLHVGAATGPAAGTGATGPIAVVTAPRRASSSTVYRPPVEGAVTRLFDPPEVRWGSGHRGVDLAASPGATVRSPGAGVVAFAGTVAGRGVVTVLHDDGRRSSLEPVEADVTPGDRVAVGTALGRLQDRPDHDGVHWGVRDGDTYLDPLSLLTRSSPVVLLPATG